jgi:hypothetical protein
MATNQSQYQSEDITSLEAFRQDRNQDSVREIVSNRKDEVLAAVMCIEAAIRAFGLDPQALQEITATPEPVVTTPDNVIDMEAKRTELRPEPVATYDTVVEIEAKKAELSRGPTEAMNADEKLANVFEIHDQAMSGQEIPDQGMPNAA